MDGRAMVRNSLPTIAGTLLSTLLLLFPCGHGLLDLETSGRTIQYLRPPKNAFLDPSPWEVERGPAAAHETVDLSAYAQVAATAMESDRIDLLPGQPGKVDFHQYAGYVTVEPTAGRALFYYFAEAPSDITSSAPLVLWLNGGPGCSSFGNGAMLELGPFRVEDGKSLKRNTYSWNTVANVLFLESPAGVGFSYSNTTSDNGLSGDRRTAQDSYVFLLKWLERFPQYRGRDFYIAGESYAGHYIPQLAHKILHNNKHVRSDQFINLRGIAMGNAYLDDETANRGLIDFFWRRDFFSDELHQGIISACNFSAREQSQDCNSYAARALASIGGIDIYNIYAPLCTDVKGTPLQDVGFDPCSDDYVHAYLNDRRVQNALHVKPTSWSSCSSVVNRQWRDAPSTLLPLIRSLMATNSTGLRVWLYSGDVDGRVPITATKYAIQKLKPLKEITPWRPWYSHGEMSGYAVEYEGLVLVTVRGAGHLVPSNQPVRALTMFSSFLAGKLPPVSPS